MSFSFNFGFKDGKVQAPAPPPPKQATHTPQTTTSTSSSLIETKKTFKVKLEHGTQLLTGATLPLIGSGTWQLNNRQTVRMVESALAEGIRLIDTAAFYRNEAAVGQVLRALEEQVPREEMFITTKLWSDDLGSKRAGKAFDKSLKTLGLSYVDLYLMHWPADDAKTTLQTWRVMEVLHSSGRARAIGVSNFGVSDLEVLLNDCDIIPAVNQIEFHPKKLLKQLPILKFCQKHGIIVQGSSPLGQTYNLLRNATVAWVSNEIQRSPAQILLRWSLQHGIGVIPRTKSPERLSENTAIFDFTLSSHHMLALDALSDPADAPEPQSCGNDSDDDDEDDDFISPPIRYPPHPQGVQPQGNLWLLDAESKAQVRTTRSRGLGSLAWLSDLTLLKIFSLVDAESLAALCAVSNVLSAFASAEELWKPAYLHLTDSALITRFPGSWKASSLAYVRSRSNNPNNPPSNPERGGHEREPVFSDTLYRLHKIAHGPSVLSYKPKGPAIARLTKHAIPSQAFFQATFETGIGRPVVLEAAGEEAVESGYWQDESLVASIGERVLHAGGVNFTLKAYLEYARCNVDDLPLYLFDPQFSSSIPELLGKYMIPPCFRDDLFDLFDRDATDETEHDTGHDTKSTTCTNSQADSDIPQVTCRVARVKRPDYRWLLAGGKRTGQSWHKDPNGTSAWNLTLRGRKRWLMFPPHITPPGVQLIGHDYVAPLSVEEWANGFYREACQTRGFVEGVTNPGDVMYVPRGWWHLVCNLETPTIAISHHFTSPAGLPSTLKFLKEAPEQISGVDRKLSRDTEGSVHDRAADDRRRVAAGVAVREYLVQCLKEYRPEALAKAEEVLQRTQEAELARAAKKKRKIQHHGLFQNKISKH